MSLIDKIAKGGPLGIYSEHVIPGSQGPIAPAKPFAEIGVTGLLRTRGTGILYEEWLNNLSTYRQRYVYREMRDNDAVIGSMFFALENILRKAEWRVEPAAGPKGNEYAEFVHSCMEDMSSSWEDFISENVSMFAFGFSLFETVYKKRNGPDGRKASRFDDGLIGWRKFAPRAQESILYWIWDDDGGLQGAVQLAAPDYHTVPIPIEKLLLFRTTSLKNNPEGRPCRVDERVPTPYGWTTMLDIEPGDKVFDETGAVRTVTGKSEVFTDRPVYEVEFTSGGKVAVDAVHPWSVTTHNDRFNGKQPRDLTTEELYRIMQNGKPNHFCCGQAPALDLPDVNLPLDPYYLGYWLGNGKSTASRVTCHEDDADEIASLITDCGYTVVVHDNNTEERKRDMSVCGAQRWDAKGPSSLLRSIGVMNNKHVPPEYLRASEKQRLALLQGLMDSDGHSQGREGDASSFANGNRSLIDAVSELVRSLGGQPRFRVLEKAGSLGGFVNGRQIVARQDHYEISFMLEQPCHRLTRKRDRQIARKTSRNSGHFIKSITRVDNADTMCIEVDSPSHLFLVGECMVPTHNSVLRNCYRSWFLKRRIEEVEGIGIERDLCGIPVLYASAEALAAMGGEAAARQLVTNIRMDDQMGVILPLAYDDNKNPLVKLELLKSAGPKQTDADKTISRYNSDILNTMLAGFVQFGQTPTGSRSMHMSATQIFSLAIGAYMDSTAAVMNRIAIPRLMRLNKMDLKQAPKLVAGEIGVRDLEEMSTYCQQLSMAGCSFFDRETQNFLRKMARMPPLPEDDEDNKPPVPDASTPQDQNGPMPDPVKGAAPKPQPNLDQPGVKQPGAVPSVPRTRATSTPAG